MSFCGLIALLHCVVFHYLYVAASTSINPLRSSWLLSSLDDYEYTGYAQVFVLSFQFPG